MKLYKFYLSFYIFSINGLSYGQTVAEIGQQFGQKKYEQVLVNARQLIEKEPGSAFAYGIIGAVYVREAKYDSCVLFSQKAILSDNDSTYISGWAHADLGMAYVNTNRKEKGIKELKRSLQLGFTQNAINYAQHILDSLGVDYERSYPKNYLPRWVTIEGKNITYRFQDTTGLSAAIYKLIEGYEKSYDTLNTIFQPKLPSKVILHVWEDPEIAEKILHREPAFGNYSGCFGHVTRVRLSAFPLNYILAYWSWGSKNIGYDQFTDAGICSCFDLLHNDKLANARWAIEKGGITSVMDVWEKPKKYDKDTLYWVAGAFIEYLYKNTPSDQFQKVVKMQKLEDVKAIYGNNFDNIVTDFDHLMGIRDK